jgi:hypothetical protein
MTHFSHRLLLAGALALLALPAALRPAAARVGGGDIVMLDGWILRRSDLEHLAAHDS